MQVIFMFLRGLYAVILDSHVIVHEGNVLR